MVRDLKEEEKTAMMFDVAEAIVRDFIHEMTGLDFDDDIIPSAMCVKVNDRYCRVSLTLAHEHKIDILPEAREIIGFMIYAVKHVFIAVTNTSEYEAVKSLGITYNEHSNEFCAQYIPELMKEREILNKALSASVASFHKPDGQKNMAAILADTTECNNKLREMWPIIEERNNELRAKKKIGFNLELIETPNPRDIILG